jgi:cold shock CspA family protein
VRYSGTLITWQDDRGFGFIAPTHGGPHLFAHISAFGGDGTRPTVGEKVSYDLGRRQNGLPQAVNVVRQAIGATVRRESSVATRAPADHGSREYFRRSSRRWNLKTSVILLLTAMLVGYILDKFESSRARHSISDQQNGNSAQTIKSLPSESSEFRCDGRIFCSQMTSCGEAKYFLNHCPDTRMDGDHNGIPCERQWCTGFFDN